MLKCLGSVSTSNRSNASILAAFRSPQFQMMIISSSSFLCMKIKFYADWRLFSSRPATHKTLARERRRSRILWMESSSEWRVTKAYLMTTTTRSKWWKWSCATVVGVGDSLQKSWVAMGFKNLSKRSRSKNCFLQIFSWYPWLLANF